VFSDQNWMPFWPFHLSQEHFTWAWYEIDLILIPRVEFMYLRCTGGEIRSSARHSSSPNVILQSSEKSFRFILCRLIHYVKLFYPSWLQWGNITQDFVICVKGPARFGQGMEIFPTGNCKLYKIEP